MNRRDFIVSASATLATVLALQDSVFFLQAQEESVPSKNPLGPLPLLFGTDYYPDQTPENLWEQDAVGRMAAAGITNVRIAEFAWALMEPQEGSFDFKWLQRAVGILHANQIAVILGTPSMAPPPWLTQKYPEVLMVNKARRHCCSRHASLHVVRRMPHTAASHSRSRPRWLAPSPQLLASSVGKSTTNSPSAKAPVLLPFLPGRIPAVAAGQVSITRRPQSGLGHRILEQHLQRFFPDSGPASLWCPTEPGAGAGLLPLPECCQYFFP